MKFGNSQTKTSLFMYVSPLGRPQERRTLHRNLLLPINSLPINVPKKPHKRRLQNKDSPRNQVAQSSDSMSDDSDNIFITLTRDLSDLSVHDIESASESQHSVHESSAHSDEDIPVIPLEPVQLRDEGPLDTSSQGSDSESPQAEESSSSSESLSETTSRPRRRKVLPAYLRSGEYIVGWRNK